MKDTEAFPSRDPDGLLPQQFIETAFEQVEEGHDGVIELRGDDLNLAIDGVRRRVMSLGREGPGSRAAHAANKLFFRLQKARNNDAPAVVIISHDVLQAA